MKSNWSLENKVALITGASKGIGLAIAEEFLNLGAEVIVVARTLDTLEQAFRHLKSEQKRIHLVPADVTKLGVKPYSSKQAI